MTASTDDELRCLAAHRQLVVRAQGLLANSCSPTWVYKRPRQAEPSLNGRAAPDGVRIVAQPAARSNG